MKSSAFAWTPRRPSAVSVFRKIGDFFDEIKFPCEKVLTEGQLRGYNKFRILLYMFGVPHLT